MLKQSRTNTPQELADYPGSLNYYNVPPTSSVTLNEFEQSGLDRLSVLMAIDSARLRVKDESELFRLIDPIISKKLELKPNNSKTPQKLLHAQRKKDHLSHYILRLAYSKTAELQKWFITCEELLFKKRFLNLTKTQKDEFLHQNKITFKNVTLKEMANLFDIKDIKSFYPENEIFYKVPFQMVLSLISKRKVLLLDGYAYVSDADKIHLICENYAKHLKSELKLTQKALPRMDEDDRIMPILYNLAKQSVGNEYVIKKDGEAVHAQDINGLINHFPPCMRVLHQSLVRDSHLKHSGRIQYGLFLKGIGLSMEEALVFWRMQFNKMSDDEFVKKGYPYNIRYNYGMEGKRTNYTPYSCLKMIQSIPGPGETHGCPFRQYSPEALLDMMMKMNVDLQSSNDVLEKAKGGNYQIACTRLFERTRGLVHDKAQKEFILLEPINHPNTWFDLSRNGYEDKIMTNK